MSSAPRLSLVKLKGFPSEFHPSGKIATVAFIESSNEVIELLEKFGKLFSPVVMDMRGNVESLLEYYKKDITNREFLEDMILTDAEKLSHPWLLWLKRALELIERFFWYVINNDDIIKEKSDSLKPMINQAYNEVLKPYHGWFLQNTFKLLYQWMPSRSTLLGSDLYFEDNIKHLKILMPRMRLHLDKINDLYLKHNLNDDRKV
ncbi:CLUMA_CG020432, isoform A [Clunio marinus]|uniref:CLUMA_CG020432, isoform A n=1 Tax=Clunio marinus TaxID=568069 RepID=A0A1J1J4Y5_9DIPT|nr:CLUMA_CG020432, isoform A [Clunio marinus]